MEVNENGLVQSIAHTESVRTIAQPEDQARAMYVDEKIRKSSLELYVSLSVMVDEKLWKYLPKGYNTATEYFQELEADLNVKRRQLYEFAEIGREFRPFALMQDGTISEGAEKASKLGQRKLYLIAKHAKEEVSRLIDEGKIELGDEELTLEDLKKKSVKALRSEMKELSEKANKTDELDARLKLKEKENQDLLNELKELRPLKEKLSTRREIKDGLKQAGEYNAAAARIYAAIDIDALDEDLQAECAMVLNITYDTLLAYRDKYPEIFDLLDPKYLTV